MSGEASPPWIAELTEMTRKAVGTEAVKVLTEFEPSEVVARGAAVYAQLSQQDPRPYRRHLGYRIDDEYDELR